MFDIFFLAEYVTNKIHTYIVGRFLRTNVIFLVKIFRICIFFANSTYLRLKKDRTTNDF